MTRRQPSSTLFPYTTLFRSQRRSVLHCPRTAPNRSPPTVRVLRPPGDMDDQPVPVLRRGGSAGRSEEHTSELQSRPHLVCRLLLEKKKVDLIICVTQSDDVL